MRSYPHQPEGATLQRLLESARPLAVPAASLTPEFMATRDLRFWTLNADRWLDVARLAYALEQERTEVVQALRESSDVFARGVAEGARFHLDQHFDQLEAALVLGDAARIALLSNLPAARHNVPGVSFPASAEREFEILADLAAARHEAAIAKLPKAADALARERLPKPLHDDIASALALQEAILRRDAAALSRAFERRGAAFAAKFRNPQVVNSPRGLLDLNALSLAALARRDGMAPSASSPYLPLGLLQA